MGEILNITLNLFIIFSIQAIFYVIIFDQVENIKYSELSRKFKVYKYNIND